MYNVVYRDIDYNSSGTFTITANSGFTTTNSTVTGTGCNLSGSTLSVSNVTKDINCYVTLYKSKWDVYVPASSSSYHSNFNQTLSCSMNKFVSIGFSMRNTNSSRIYTLTCDSGTIYTGRGSAIDENGYWNVGCNNLIGATTCNVTVR